MNLNINHWFNLTVTFLCWKDSFIKICYILFLFYKFHRKKRSYIEKKRSYTVQCFSTLFCTYVRPLFFSFEWFYNCQFGAYAMGFSHCWKPYCNLTLITSLSVCLCWELFHWQSCHIQFVETMHYIFLFSIFLSFDCGLH